MTKNKALWIFAPVAGLFMLGSVSAQDQTAGGQTIPADQIPAVQDWCKELQAQQGLTGTNEPETSMSEQQVEAATGTQGTQSEDAFDVSSVTLEMCQEAGFTDQEGD